MHDEQANPQNAVVSLNLKNFSNQIFLENRGTVVATASESQPSFFKCGGSCDTGWNFHVRGPVAVQGESVASDSSPIIHLDEK